MSAATAAWDAIIALGSNIGDKAANIDAAVAALTEAGDIRLVQRSRLYRTPPWGKTDQDWFVNACMTVATSLEVHTLLARCQAVERRLGRVHTEKWGPRTIDVDILDYRGLRVNEPDLVLPHPYMGQRAFVLAPLMDVAPDYRIGGKSIGELLGEIDARGVEPLG